MDTRHVPVTHAPCRQTTLETATTHSILPIVSESESIHLFCGGLLTQHITRITLAGSCCIIAVLLPTPYMLPVVTIHLVSTGQWATYKYYVVPRFVVIMLHLNFASVHKIPKDR